MSDFLEEEEDEQEDHVVTLKRSEIKELKALARAGKKAQEENAVLKRNETFREAGIPVGDKRASYFIKGYDGEVTPEAIKAEWDEHFGSSQLESNATDPAEAAAHERVSAASSGAEPPQTSISLEDIQSASSVEEVIRLSSEMGLLATRD